jgi:transcription antitermination protein NusB
VAALKRSEARRLALLAMYAMECTDYDASETLRLMPSLKEEWAELPEFTVQLLSTSYEHRRELEREISAILEHWRLERVGTLERALLKLACAEICFFPDIPPRVTLNEYIELAKKYGSENTPAFINGVMDRIVRLRQKPDVQIRKKSQGKS